MISLTTQPIDFSILWKLLIGPCMVLVYLFLYLSFGFRLFPYFSYSLQSSEMLGAQLLIFFIKKPDLCLFVAKDLPNHLNDMFILYSLAFTGQGKVYQGVREGN